MTTQSSPLTLFYAWLLLLLFLAGFFGLIQEFLLWKRARKWRGAATGTVVEIRKNYRYRGLFVKRWYEYPVIAYKAGSRSFRQEYTRRKRELGYYEPGEHYPLIYNEDNPSEFAFGDTFSGFFYYAGQALMLAVTIISLYYSAHFFMNHYLDTHELLWEEQTWADLERPLAAYQGMEFSNLYNYTIDNLDTRLEEDVEHFRRVGGMVEAQKSGKHDETYQNRYRASAIAAADSLGGTFSGIVGTFFEECGLEGQREAVYQSAYAGFLERVCPDAAPAPGLYSLDELLILVNFIHDSGLNPYEYRDDPEESIGLSLAVSYARLDAELALSGGDETVRTAVSDCFPGYVSLYLDQIDLHVLENRKKYGKEHYTRLNREAILSVYSYTAARYQGPDSFETALWEGSVFAREQMTARMQADPALRGLVRYGAENNPLAEFDAGMDKEPFLSSRERGTYQSPLYYLQDWRELMEDLED